MNLNINVKNLYKIQEKDKILSVKIKSKFVWMISVIDVVKFNKELRI